MNEYQNQLWDALTVARRGAEMDVRALRNQRNREVSTDESDVVFFGRISAEVYPLLAEAEKRGAVKALREAAQDWAANADPDDADDLDALVARKLDERAAIIESGEVTL